MGEGTHLNLFGDAIPFTPTGQVLSIGDVLMLGGFAVTSAGVVQSAKSTRQAGAEGVASRKRRALEEKSSRVLGRVWE